MIYCDFLIKCFYCFVFYFVTFTKSQKGKEANLFFTFYTNLFLLHGLNVLFCRCTQEDVPLLLQYYD